jgi:hypothetical protein
MRLKSVVFPAPLGPRTARRSPRGGGGGGWGAAPLAARDVVVDVAHGEEAAEAPADPPQAEDRRGAVDGGRGVCHEPLT